MPRPWFQINPKLLPARRWQPATAPSPMPVAPYGCELAQRSRRPCSASHAHARAAPGRPERAGWHGRGNVSRAGHASGAHAEQAPPAEAADHQLGGRRRQVGRRRQPGADPGAPSQRAHPADRSRSSPAHRQRIVLVDRRCAASRNGTRASWLSKTRCTRSATLPLWFLAAGQAHGRAAAPAGVATASPRCWRPSRRSFDWVLLRCHADVAHGRLRPRCRGFPTACWSSCAKASPAARC